MISEYLNAESVALTLSYRMNQSAKGRAEALRYKRSKFTVDPSSTEEESLDDRRESVDTAGPSSPLSVVIKSDSSNDGASQLIPRPLHQDRKEKALNLFFYDYVVPGFHSASCNDYLGFLPDLYHRGKSSLPLTYAVNAAALVNLANKSGINSLKSQARQFYGKSINLLRLALQDTKKATTDETLASLWILAKYESLSGDITRSSLNQIHGEGQLRLLRLRGSSRLKTPTERALFLLIHAFQQTKEIILRQKPALSLLQLPQHEDSNVKDSFGLMSAQKMSSVTYDFAYAHELILEVKEGGKNDNLAIGRLQDVTWRLIRAEKEIQSWYDRRRCQIPEVVDPKLLEARGVTLPYAWPKQIHLLENPSHGALWGRIWASRILVLQMIRDCTIALTSANGVPQGVPTEDYITRAILELVDLIFANIPCMIGDLDSKGKRSDPLKARALGGYLSLWPLIIVAMVKETSQEQFDWTVKRVEFVANAHAIRMALSIKQQMIGIRHMMQKTTL